MGGMVEGKGSVERKPTEDLLARDMGKLVRLVTDLRVEEVLPEIDRHLASGVSAEEILAACQRGMRVVGSMYGKGEYFIAGLIMAGEIMRQAVDVLRPIMTEKRSEEDRGRILIGTIAGDIHDIGKNLFKDLLECHGFTVMDLGVDVSPADFLLANVKFRPQLIAVSLMITESLRHLRELVESFEASTQGQDERPLILIGGGQVDDRIYRMSGSDFWALDAFSGVQLCQRLTADGGKRTLEMQAGTSTRPPDQLPS